MDKNKHLTLEDQKGSEMTFSLRSEFNDERRVWKTVGRGTFGTSFDLETWGTITEEAMAYDNDLMTSVAIVMKSLSETVYGDDFQSRLLDAIYGKAKE